MQPSICDRGWHDGSCCCNCINQIELFKHPWNIKYRGKTSETTNLFVCKPHQIEEFSEKRKGILMENNHGFCELWKSRKKKA